jgi:hypothetical protein
MFTFVLIVGVAAPALSATGIPMGAVGGPRKYFYAENLSGGSTTSTSYQNAVTLQFTPDANSTYLIIASWIMGESSTSYQVQAQLVNTTQSENFDSLLVFRPKATTDNIGGGGMGIDNFGASPVQQTYVIRYCTNNASGKAYIRQAKIFAIKLTSADQYITSENLSTTTSTSYQTKATLTLTPSVADNYIIIASAVGYGSANNQYFRVQENIDGTAYSNENVMPNQAVNRYFWGTVKIVNLSATSHTITIQYCSSATSATAGIENAVIVALPVSEFANVYYVENEARTTTTSVTYVNKTTLTGTPVADNYLIIGSAGLDESNTSGSVYSQLIDNLGDNYGTMAVQPNNAGCQGFSFFAIGENTLQNVPMTWNIQYKSSSASYTAGIKNARIAVLGLSMPLPPPTKPTLLSPSNGTTTTDNTPTFTWSVSTYADNYHLQVGNDNNFSSPAIDVWTASIAYTPTAELSDGLYYWRVVAHNTAGDNYSDNWTLTIDTTAPPVPSLISPPNGTITSVSTQTFKWTSVSDPSTPVTYNIQVDNDPSFSSPEENVAGLTDNTYTSSAFADENYSWRVRARDNAGNIGNWSGVWTLLIDTTTPPVPSLISPENDNKILDNRPTFKWTSVTDPSGVTYQIQIDDNADFSSPVYSAIDLHDNFDNNEPALGMFVKYFWHVRAKDGAGNIGNWSVTWNFTVVPVGAIGLLLMPLLLLLPFLLMLRRQNRRYRY